MIVLVDTNDSRAVRNKDNVLAFYEVVINQKKSEERVADFISPAYIQHNPLIADVPVALGQFFGSITGHRAFARAVVHKITAAGGYVFPPLSFRRLFNAQPSDSGISVL